MKISILSLFPDYFRGPFDQSILRRAKEKGLVEIEHVDLRSYGEGGYKKVDDRTYGGGDGMVLMAGPLHRALDDLESPGAHVVHLSPQGRPLRASDCARLAQHKHLVLLCGHYEGIDQRVIDERIDEEISIGDYVLTNGCLPAIVLTDAVVRHVPGVLKRSAVENESFQEGMLDWPHYTRPEEHRDKMVPPVLLSGDHRSIEKWRRGEALAKTIEVRPELLADEMARDLGEAHSQVVLFVADMDVSKAFYKKVFGMTVEHGRWQIGDMQLVFKEGRQNKAADVFIALRGNHGRLEEKLKKLKVAFWKADDRLTFDDPDGHHITLLEGALP